MITLICKYISLKRISLFIILYIPTFHVKFIIMWFLIVFIIYLFVVVIIRLLLSTLLVDLLHQTYPWPIRGLRFVQNVSMFWMNPILIFPELSISRKMFRENVISRKIISDNNIIILSKFRMTCFFSMDVFVKKNNIIMIFWFHEKNSSSIF